MNTNVLYKEPMFPSAINRLLDFSLRGLLNTSAMGIVNNHLLEAADAYVMEVAVPGMKKKNLKLEVANGRLTIQGERTKKSFWGWGKKNLEYRKAQFYRTISLPEDADADHIKAKYKNGLLSVYIPKHKNQSTHRSIPVQSVEQAEKLSWWQRLSKPFKRFTLRLKKA